MIISGVHIDRPQGWTADELLELHKSGRLRGVTLKGYLWRHDFDGRGRFVHFTDPTANRIGEPGGGLRQWEFPDPLPEMRAAVERESPIVKRTPQQRVASMVAKLSGGERGQEAASKMILQMLAGNQGAQGLTDEQVKEITGKSWSKGEPLDADTVRRVAAHYLGQAEREAMKNLREATGRAGRKARREQERLEASERRKYARMKAVADKNHESGKKYL